MSTVLYEQDGAVVKLTLNRPEHMNSYNVEMHWALHDSIDKADKDPSVRVIVITGAGKLFCAGADISGGFEALGGGSPMEDGVARDLGGLLNLRIFNSDTPIIAAINGSAVGVGATMLLPMDIKIASNKAKFAFPFSRRGIVFDGVASFFLPRIVGLSKAQEWILKGDIIKADEAHSAGMISELVEPDQVLTRAMELAHDIAQNVSPQSAAINKQLLRASMLGGGKYADPTMNAHMLESVHLEKRFVSPDCIEGVRSFLEKRAPNFADNVTKED